MTPDQENGVTGLLQNDFRDSQYILGLSIIGESHIKNGLPCQDACKFITINPEITLIAVSDGLGSASNSDIGAMISVNSVVDYLTDSIKENDFSLDKSATLLKAAIDYVRDGLKKKALFDNNPLSSYACTLIVVLIFKQSAIIAQIGDGAVVAGIHDTFHVISAPEDQEYINEVTPVTSNSWESALRISGPVTDIDTITVFTDGCQRAILMRNNGVLEANSQFLGAFYSYLKTLANFSEKEQFIRDIIESKKFSEISDDDKTLVVAVFGSTI